MGLNIRRTRGVTAAAFGARYKRTCQHDQNSSLGDGDPDKKIADEQFMPTQGRILSVPGSRLLSGVRSAAQPDHRFVSPGCQSRSSAKRSPLT